MSTYNEFFHTSFLHLLSHQPDLRLKRLYQDNIIKFSEKWAGKYNSKQTIFMSRCISYVSILREILTKNNEIDWSLLPADFPVLGPKFLPPSIQSAYLRMDSVSNYYTKAFTIIDLELYCPAEFKRKNMRSHKMHSSAAGIHRKDITLPKQCYGLNDMEYLVGVVHLCTSCKKSSTSSSMDFWKGDCFETPGKR